MTGTQAWSLTALPGGQVIGAAALGLSADPAPASARLPPHAASDAARPSVTASIAAAAGMAPKLSHSATMCRMRLAPDDDFELELELDELPSPGDESAVLSARLATQLGGA